MKHYRSVGLAASLAILLGLIVGALDFTPVAAVSVSTTGMIPSVAQGSRYEYAGKAINAVTFNCQKPTATVHCYAPQQIRAAYDIQPLLDKGITGKGQTIVIVDAFQSPTIAHDLALFNQVFGLPNSTLNIIAPDGLTPFNPNDANHVGWAGEITLDVEWAHAVAPGATIDLVLAKSNDDADILSATKYAVDHNLGAIISQSFGEAESCVDPTILKKQHEVFKNATHKHITLFASAGDQGSAQPTCDGSSYILSASSPATDPLVTAVGGTQLFADYTTGAYNHEVVWNEVATFGDAGGGGFSKIYPKPLFQEDVPGINKWRGTPDVAYNAAIDGGVLAVWSSSGFGADLVFIFGGTSAGSPQWAGIAALANQSAHQRLGFLNPSIYRIAEDDDVYSKAFHDITQGNNAFTDGIVNIPGYSAHKGWDAATGWGTPKTSKLVPLLVERHSDQDGFGDEDGIGGD